MCRSVTCVVGAVASGVIDIRLHKPSSMNRVFQEQNIAVAISLLRYLPILTQSGMLSFFTVYWRGGDCKA